MLPLLLLVLAGAIDMGRMAYLALHVTNAARAGALYGAQSQATAADFGGMRTAAINNSNGIPLNSAPAASKSCRCSNWAASTADVSNCSPVPACTSPGRLVTYVQVTTAANYVPWFPYPGVPGTMTITQSSSMRVGQ